MLKDITYTEPDILQRTARMFEAFLDQYPSETDAAIWFFLNRTNNHFGKTQHSSYLNASGFYESAMDATISNERILSLFTQEQHAYNWMKRHFESPEDMDEVEAFSKWNDAIAEKEIERKKFNHFAYGKYHIQFPSYIGWAKMTGKRDLFDYHRSIFQRFQSLSEDIDLETAHEAIAEMKKGLVPTIFRAEVIETSIDQVIADAPLPNITDNAIAEMVSSVESNSYDDIAKFGLSLTLDFAKALRDITSHFTRNAARPAQTFERAEVIMVAVGSINVDAAVMGAPTGSQKLLSRLAGVRLVLPQQNPLYKASELANELPELAEIDSASYSDDLKLAQHAIKLSVAYADIVARAHTAFVEDRQRIVPDASSSTAEDLAMAGIPDAFDKTVRSLQAKVSFLNIQAGSFGDIASRIADSQRNLGGIAILSQALQTPALQAVRLFNIYQAKRIQSMGRAVSDKILDQLELNQTAILGRGSVDRQSVMNEFETAQGQIEGQLTQLITTLTGEVDERVEIAEKIETDVTAIALGHDPKLDL